jgi:quinol monooxygenase YgiN
MGRLLIIIVLMLFGLSSFTVADNTDKVNIMAIMHPKKGQEKRLITVLRSFIKSTRSEEGCLVYNVHQTKDGVVFLYEVWRSQNDLEAHLKKPYIVDFVNKISDFIEGENDIHFGKLISPEKKITQTSSDFSNSLYISSIKVPLNLKSPELKNELEKLVEPTHSEPGCQIYNLYEEKDGSLFLYEVWQSRKDLEQHFEKTYVKDFRKKVDNLAKRNEVYFGQIISLDQ